MTVLGAFLVCIHLPLVYYSLTLTGREASAKQSKCGQSQLHMTSSARSYHKVQYISSNGPLAPPAINLSFLAEDFGE